MFSNSFYPTPEEVVLKMIRPWKLDGAYVLDPEAGKGDMLDPIAAQYKWASDIRKRPKLYAVEINPDLRAILAGKGYPVVGEDFLSYAPSLQYSHVIMSPPFDRGEEHLLHAWDILAGGEIACLLDVRSLEGKSAKEQVVLNLIEDHGTREDLGKCYRYAERPTDVEVALIRLHKAGGERLDWDLRNDRPAPEFDTGPGAEVALRGFIDAMLAGFDAALAHYAAYAQARTDIKRYMAPIGSDLYRERESRTVDILKTADEGGTPRDQYNIFVELLQERAWHRLLDHPGFQAILTDRARKMMADFRARQERVDFNAYNVRFFDALVAMQGEIAVGAVLDAFETMSKYHEDNRVYTEGWKSNKSWRVARRVVLPNFIDRIDPNKPYDTFGIKWDNQQPLLDIDRALCVVSGQPFKDCLTIVQALENQWRSSDYAARTPGSTVSSHFNVQYYKKGTLHLYFRDAWLWNEFNLQAARGRGWLGDGS
jgi:hypothetical protein